MITLSVGNNNGVATIYNVTPKENNLPSGKIVSRRGSKALGRLSFKDNIPQKRGKFNSNSTQKSEAKIEQNSDTRFSIDKGKTARDAEKITADMSDSERTEILKNKTFEAPVYNGEADESIKLNYIKLTDKKIKVIKDTLKKMGEEFEVYHNYNIADIIFDVFLSKETVGESVQKGSSRY